MSIIINFIRLVISIIFIPVCVSVTMSLYNNILAIKSVNWPEVVFILGALAYSCVHLLLLKLNFLYVLIHEVTHAITALFSGGKVLGMKVSSDKGSVKTTAPNFFVTLAPYLIPGYTVIIAILFFISSFVFDTTRYLKLFIFLMGFTMMFHLAYTAESIREKQSDLLKAGYFLSISLIYTLNVIILFAIVSFFFKELSFLKFIVGSYEQSRDIYYSIWKQLFL